MNYSVKPSLGLGDLVFGMKIHNVVEIIGNQFIKMIDDDNNHVYTYHKLQIRLTFYADEDFRLGYIVSNHPELKINNQLIIGQLTSEVKKEFKQANTWETTTNEDYIIHHFNENIWIDLHEEFFIITKIEIGATIKNLDEFDWKFHN